MLDTKYINLIKEKLDNVEDAELKQLILNIN